MATVRHVRAGTVPHLRAPVPRAHPEPVGPDPDLGSLAVQVVGRLGEEGTVLRLAGQLEAARPWFDRRPALAVPA
jgi:Asp-tRNA(Asn)/Glu-tRNA(Gln) amidotransferase A subunit family amidase